MARSGLTEEFVRRVTRAAREAGIDAERLGDEVADHLAEASARYRTAGLPDDEAQRRAIEEFGDAGAFVSAVAASTKGGTMAQTTRMAAAATALAATAVLLVAHINWDGVGGSPFQVVSAGAAIALGLSGLAWVWASRRDFLAGRSVWPLAAWLAAAAALGTLVAWAGRIGSLDLAVGGRPYLAAVGFLALLVAIAARLLRTRVAAGVGLVVAGGLALLLNGALGGTWRPLGSIGSGQGNLAIELIVIGWVLVGFAWVSGPNASWIRSSLGTFLIWLGRRLRPNGASTEARPETTL